MPSSYGSAEPQRIAIHENGAELAVVTVGTETIAGGLAVVLDTTHQLGGADPLDTSRELTGIAVTLPAADVPAVGSLGILTGALAPGRTAGTVRVRGVCGARIAGSPLAGALLSICPTSAGDKRGWLQEAAEQEEAIAQLLEDGADGETRLVRLFGGITIIPSPAGP